MHFLSCTTVIWLIGLVASSVLWLTAPLSALQPDNCDPLA